MELNLKDLKRQTLKVTFQDDRVINVLSPRKAVYDSLDILEQAIAEADTNSVLTPIYKALAGMLSNNLEQEKVTVKYLEENADLEVLNWLINGYMAFCDEIANAKNWSSPLTRSK